MIRSVVKPARHFGYLRLLRHANQMDSKNGVDTFLVKANDKDNEFFILQSKLSSQNVTAQRTDENENKPASSPSLDGEAPEDTEAEDDYILKLHPTRSAKSYWYDVPGGVIWRCFRFIGDVKNLRITRTPDVAGQAFHMLARFHERQCNLPTSFQDMFLSQPTEDAQYYEALLDAISKNPEGRVEKCHEEIKYAKANKFLISMPSSLRYMGSIPNPTKPAVVEESIHTEPRPNGDFCAVDLNTVAPSLAGYGAIGEEILIADYMHDPYNENRTEDDATDQRLHTLLIELNDILTRNEHKELILLGRQLAHNIGLRLLTDYILGDIEFPSDFAGHNLLRSREMFMLSCRIEECKNRMLYDEMEMDLA